jgi:hypothetical protein
MVDYDDLRHKSRVSADNADVGTVPFVSTAPISHGNEWHFHQCLTAADNSWKWVGGRVLDTSTTRAGSGLGFGASPSVNKRGSDQGRAGADLHEYLRFEEQRKS